MSSSIVRRVVFVLAIALTWGHRDLRAGWPWGKSDKVKVWVDDAHTSKITVDRLKPDEIAKKTTKGLKLSLGVRGFGVSADWLKKKGIEYDDRAKKLIAKLKQLCLQFNRGKMSLETYNRRLRGVYVAEEKARDIRMRVLLLTRMDARRGFAKLDKVLGLPPLEVQQSKEHIEALLDEFRKSVEGVSQKAPDAPTAEEGPAGKPDAKALFDQAEGENKRDVDDALATLDRRLTAAPPPKKGEIIQVWKNDARTKRIKVRKLDCESIVKDVEASMSVGAKFFIFDMGPKAKRVLSTKAKYGRAAKMLILKYKQLCVEYNAGLVSQESYARRLQELSAAEEKARHTRYEVFRRLQQQAQEGFDDLEKVLEKQGGKGKSEAVSDLERMAQKLNEKAFKKPASKRDDGPSLVKKISSANQDRIAESSLAEFQKSVENVAVERDEGTVEVWVDDAKTKKVTTAKLNPDLLAQNVKQKLGLHLAFYSFGPEMVWAKDQGTSYDHAAQMLILKYRQLMMDYNAGLVSQEALDRRRREIDAAIEKAELAREAMFVFMRRLAREAFAELDAHLDRTRAPR